MAALESPSIGTIPVTAGAQLNKNMKKNYVIWSVLTVLALYTTGCKKEEKNGCRDADAVNYDAAAEADCNCCKYTGEIGFWTDDAKAQEFLDNGITQLKFYLDGDYVGMQPAGQYFNSAPSCENPDVISIQFDLGASKTGSTELTVRDQDDDLVLTSTLSVAANTCTMFQLQ